MATGTGSEVVVLTGAASPLGRRVAELLVQDPAVGRVVGLDAAPVAPSSGVEGHRVDLATADLKPLLEGATTLLHLAQGDYGDGLREVAVAHRLLEAAGAVGVGHLVLVSSAAAYGAWANNPVPLTEDAALRPNPGVPFATGLAELERAAADFRDDHPGTTVALLRPVPVVSPEGNSWLARSLRRSSPLRVADTDPPAQFLDLADLATAVDVVRRQRVDGPRNVAPDGWIDGEVARSLAGGTLRLRLPEQLTLRLAAVGWRWGVQPTPPALLPYAVHPWVVANDRLKGDGWVPASSNEEAFVASHEAGPWATLSPSRRQELALGLAGVGILGVVAGAVALVRRRRRR